MVGKKCYEEPQARVVAFAVSDIMSESQNYVQWDDEKWTVGGGGF